METVIKCAGIEKLNVRTVKILIIILLKNRIKKK